MPQVPSPPPSDQPADATGGIPAVPPPDDPLQRAGWEDQALDAEGDEAEMARRRADALRRFRSLPGS